MRVPPRLLERAKAGDPVAQCRIAHRLMSSERPSGYRAAMPWLRRAATRDQWAAYHLGLIYDHGLGIHPNRTAAISWYERAAAKGYDSAQLNLGIILANLSGAKRDEARAVRLYRSAARQGNRNAAYNLGLYYSEGRGVVRNLRMARHWFEEAAAKGDRDAAKTLRSLPVASLRLQRMPLARRR
jgi:TPR repeat protein